MSELDPGSSREARFDEIVADFIDALDAGESPNEDEIVSQNQDLEVSLRKFFVDHRRMEGLLDASSEPGRADHVSRVRLNPDSATKSPADQPTLGYDEVTSEVLAAQQIGDYLLLDKIAQGGMGIVYRARQISLNRIVAVKMIRAGDLADEEEVQRFRVEAEAAAQLQHPGIVPIYQIGSDHGQHFFSMAYVEGKSLAQVVRDGPLKPRIAATYVMKVARAAHYAHERGIIHRDIKPANVLLDRHDEPMVMDFGLAKQIKSDHELTISGQILGTASYMPPEQASGKTDQITARSDVYSLGALLYTLLTQRPPFTGENPLDVLLDVLSKDPASPSSLNITMSRDLETICMKCLDKLPHNRYVTAEDLAEDLQRYLDGKPIVARPISKAERLLRWCRRKPAYATAILLASLLVVGMPAAYILDVGDDAQRALEHNAELGKPTIVKPSLLQTARDRYADVQPVSMNAGDQVYALATDAMLQFNKKDSRHPAEPYFQETADMLESALQTDPTQEGYQSALADCYFQLAKYRLPGPANANLTELQIEASRRFLGQAIEILSSLRTAHANSAELRSRAATAHASLSAYPTDFANRQKILLEAKALSRDWSDLDGIIRFEFAPPAILADDPRQLDLESLRAKAVGSAPTDQMAYAHGLLLHGYAQEAFRRYVTAFTLLEPGHEMEPALWQRCFTDLARIDEVTPEAIATLPESIWPLSPRGFYHAVLGIRLAEGLSAASLSAGVDGK